MSSEKGSSLDSGYYLGLEHLENHLEFQKWLDSEFVSTPLREGGEESRIERREFLKLMGASLAMASVGCIRRPVQKIVPYNRQPEEVVFGVDNFYTSTWFDGLDAAPILVRTREGRPLRYKPLEGFDEWVGLPARAHAHLLSLYDPDRLRSPKKNLLNQERTNRDTISASWEEVDEKVTDAVKKGKAALLTGNIGSPALRRLIQDFVQAFGVRHYQWQTLSASDLVQGFEKSFGRAEIPYFRFDEAQVIVSVDADFLGTWPLASLWSRLFSEGRRQPEKMSELIVFESGFSLTGANADNRFHIKPSHQLLVAGGLAWDILVSKKRSSLAQSPTIQFALQDFAEPWNRLGIEPVRWNRVVNRLLEAGPKALVIAGGGWASTHADAVSVQVLVNLVNTALGAVGNTIDFSKPIVGFQAREVDLWKLIESMEKGEVQTLIVADLNPVFDGPLASRFREATKKVGMVVHLTSEWNETSDMAHYVLPLSHPQESWGDLEVVAGNYHLHQPTIRPLYESRDLGFFLMTLAYTAEVGPKRLKDLESFYDYLRDFVQTEILPRSGLKSFDEAWFQLQEKGFLKLRSGDLPKTRVFQDSALKNLSKLKLASGIELVPYGKVAFPAGSLMNSPWLHELPDPITKIVWDNYAMVSLALAKELKLKEGQVVRISVDDQSVELPAHIQPGLPEGVISVAIGYGRQRVGRVGKNVGVNVYPLGSWNKDHLQFAGRMVKVEALDRKVALACVQSHHAMEGRQIVIEATRKEYDANPAANIHKHDVFSIWPGHAYHGHRWGMVVDLNVCTGCSACMVACQAENNIPVVGKKYVLKGREMHWIRVDRYFVGSPEKAEVVFQPVMCQQCENAPCETVCPVLATVHSDEGLNDMVYNRCVGTRYCANNCPYKVRRFNWFNYTKNIPKPQHLALNPDVTVRSRGVMEKCTFCVHRIKAKRIEAKTQGRALKDQEIKTACQESCPTGAIVFGDLNDPESQVSRIFRENPRSYRLLEEWNAAPSVRYLTKIRNNGEDHRPNGHSQHQSHS